MSLPYSSCTPATTVGIDGLYPDKLDECHAAGAALRNLMEREILPRDIMVQTPTICDESQHFPARSSHPIDISSRVAGACVSRRWRLSRTR